MALMELIEKEADGDLVREMPAFAAARIMEIEVVARDLRRPRQPIARSNQSPQRLSGASLG